MRDLSKNDKLWKHVLEGIQNVLASYWLEILRQNVRIQSTLNVIIVVIT